MENLNLSPKRKYFDFPIDHLTKDRNIKESQNNGFPGNWSIPKNVKNKKYFDVLIDQLEEQWNISRSDGKMAFQIYQCRKIWTICENTTSQNLSSHNSVEGLWYDIRMRGWAH